MTETKTKNRLNIKLRDIVILQDRGRQQFTKLQEMAESIKRYGVIEPIVVARKEDKYVLVAGERRYRGAILAGLENVPVVLREDAEDILAEIELEENVCRVDISFEEQGRIFEKIQKLKKREDGTSFGLREVAEMTNRSLGDVSGKIKIAKEFRERPDLREACANLPYTAAIKKIEQIKEAEKAERLHSQGKLQITSDLLHGSCVDLIKDLPDDSIDCVVTDPPYGLEKLESIREHRGSKKFAGHQLMSADHNLTLDGIVSLLTELAPELSRVMKDGAHFYMFCGFQYVGDFINALSPHLEFQPPLLIWDRGKPSAPAYGYNYMSRTEAIIYGYNPPRGRRLNDNVYNILPCPDVPKNLRVYPTEKPTPLLKVLIENSTQMNHVILDPFAGSASTLIAARHSNRKGIGFEINKESFFRAQNRLRKDLEE